MFTTGFKTLLRLRVEHEYFAPGSVLAFGLEPLPPSARQLRASRLLWKRRENQWALVWEGRNGGFAGEDGPQRLRFAMSSAMPLWVNASDLPPFSANSEQLYIELDAAAGQERARAGAEHLFALERPRPMLELPPESPWRLLDLGGQELSRAPRGDGSLWMAPEEWGDGPFELWRGMELERRFLFAGQAASNRLGIMELRLPPLGKLLESPLELELRFGARQAFWRYELHGQNTDRPGLAIEDEAGIVAFAREDGPRSSRFLSQEGIGLSDHPAQRFQLVEATAQARRVLVARLAAPTPADLRPLDHRDGQWAAVRHVFL